MAFHATSCSSHPPAVALLLLMVIFTAFSAPSICSSSRSSLVAETTPLPASVNEMSGNGRFNVAPGGRGGGDSAAASAREVPTGPNPLHHNHKPITKPRKDHIVTHP